MKVMNSVPLCDGINCGVRFARRGHLESDCAHLYRSRMGHLSTAGA